MDTNQPIPINTIISETPQVQTVLQDGLTPVTTVINAPWVNVTSVNGRTGDVAVTAEVVDYQPGIGYLKGDIVTYENELYYALSDFVGGVFNPSQWRSFADANQKQANWLETNTGSASYIQNKPTKLSQFTNDLDLVDENDVKNIVNTQISSLENEVDELGTIVTNHGTQITSLSGAVSSLSVNKVDVVPGMGLSDNNYTSSEKNKLFNLADIESVGTGLSLSSGVLRLSPNNSFSTSTLSTYSCSYINGLVDSPVLVKLAGYTLSANTTASNGYIYYDLPSSYFSPSDYKEVIIEIDFEPTSSATSGNYDIQFYRTRTGTGANATFTYVNAQSRWRVGHAGSSGTTGEFGFISSDNRIATYYAEGGRHVTLKMTFFLGSSTGDNTNYKYEVISGDFYPTLGYGRLAVNANTVMGIKINRPYCQAGSMIIYGLRA